MKELSERLRVKNSRHHDLIVSVSVFRALNLSERYAASLMIGNESAYLMGLR